LGGVQKKAGDSYDKERDKKLKRGGVGCQTKEGTRGAFRE